MVNVLKLTLESTQDEVIVNSGIGSHTPCFSLDFRLHESGGVEVWRKKGTGPGFSSFCIIRISGLPEGEPENAACGIWHSKISTGKQIFP